MKRLLILFVLIILLIAGFFVYWNYYNVYSSGERKGALIKITRKGNVFKTVEGEMWLSCRNMVNAEKFYFSVDNKAVADSLEHLQDECLEVQYQQYRRALPWRGDMEYIVVGYRKIQ